MRYISLILIASLFMISIFSVVEAKEILCPACGTANISAAKYCKSCGASLEPKKEKTGKSKMLKLSGVRIGATYIYTNPGPKGLDEDTVLTRQGIDPPIIAQIGWQLEKRFGEKAKSNVGVLALVALAGGFNHGKIIPGLTGIIGFRLKNGIEFGGGPNVTGTKDKHDNYRAEPGFAWTLGYSTKFGRLVLPLNVAVVQTASGLRFSFLSGFIWEKEMTK